MSLTTDPTVPCLHETTESGQNKCYLILSDEERSKGFVRPLMNTYTHIKCGVKTSMALPIAETYARKPEFYGATYCCSCGTHFPLVDKNGVRQFRWVSHNVKGIEFVGE